MPLAGPIEYWAKRPYSIISADTKALLKVTSISIWNLQRWEPLSARARGSVTMLVREETLVHHLWITTRSRWIRQLARNQLGLETRECLRLVSGARQCRGCISTRSCTRIYRERIESKLVLIATIWALNGSSQPIYLSAKPHLSTVSPSPAKMIPSILTVMFRRAESIRDLVSIWRPLMYRS